MNNDLKSVTRTLRDLLRNLPAVRNRSSADTLRKHLALIAYFQRRYDRLIATARQDSLAATARQH